MAKTRAELLELRLAASRAIRASEKWESAYTKDRKTFERLVAEEAALDQSLAEYFYGLATQRLAGLINWAELQHKVHADVVPPASDDVWKAEVQILFGVTEGHIAELITIGGQAGEVLYKSPIGISRISELVLDAAQTKTSELVSGVTETTRDLVRSAINRGLAAGEPTSQITERVYEVVNNPVRADMIARTESVNSYQLGLRTFAKETGAKSKTWEALLNACRICSPLNGVTVKIDRPFMSPIGPVMQPAAHPRCRCGVIYNY